jgi:hypothetical protein
VDDRSTPEQAWRSFQGAVARGEHEREWDLLSDPLRRKLGMGSLGEWKDARAVGLTQGHRAIRGIVRSDLGAARGLPDGRVELELRFPFGYRGTVRMRRIAVLLAFRDGSLAPFLYEHLPALEVGATPRGLEVEVPAELLLALGEGDLDGIARIEAARIWFLDDFAIGDDDPETVRRGIEDRGGAQP